MTNNISQIYVGIDIAKDFLDVYIHPIGKSQRIDNNEQGMLKLIKLFSSYQVGQIVYEATGGYEYLVHNALRKQGYNAWRVNPRRLRAFIVSERIKAKTDKIDARMIALFASQKTPNYQTIEASSEENQLLALAQHRTCLLRMAVEEENRSKHPQQIHCKDMMKSHVDFLRKQIQEIEEKVSLILRGNDELKRRADIIESVPGLGKITALSLITEVPELGRISDKQIASLLGVAPFIQQSGASKGRAHTSGGRIAVRSIIYMATLAATRFNPVIKEFYDRLRAAGKKPKVAIVAAMRKIITILNTMLNRDETWQAG